MKTTRTLLVMLTVTTLATSAVASPGTVKWFDSTKGYGFITPDDGGDDLFSVAEAGQADDGLYCLIDCDIDTSGVLHLWWLCLPDGCVLYEYFGLSADAQSLAHLFKYDTVMGKWSGTIEAP